MSITKQVGYRRTSERRNRANASDYKSYLEQGLCEDMSIHYDGCSKDWDQDFTTIAKENGKLNNNIAIEYVESWNPEESNRMGYEKLFSMSIENAREAFPGHAFVVVPQVSKNGNFHTHILFCTVAEGKEKRMYSDFDHRKTFRKVSDKNSRENGLSTLDTKSFKQKERLSLQSYRQLRQGRIPYQLQIMEKADFARRIAENMYEFIGYMGELGITVNDRGNSLSFFHEAKEKAVRGRKLGLNYTKEHLNERFEHNKHEFKTRLHLKGYLRDQLRSIHDERGDLVGDKSNFPFHPGGHQRFENQTAGKGRAEHSFSNGSNNSNHYSDSLFGELNDIISYCASKSIPDYCRKNGIGLNENKDGSFTLKGRENILIRGNKWENTKQKRGNAIGTRGSLIEFAANHKRLSLIGAMSEITGNKGLLALEQYLGKEERSYREFYIPKAKRKNEKESISLLGSLVKQLGFKSDFSRQLYNMKQVQVKTDGVIRLLSGSKAKGAVEYKQDKNGKWNKSLLGSLRSGVLKQSGLKKDLKLFKNLFSFIHETNGKGVMDFTSSDNLLVLGDDKMESLDLFLAVNPKVKHIELFGFDSKSLPKTMTLELRKRDITFTFMEEDARQRSKGLDLSL